jgi:hypothetical protein
MKKIIFNVLLLVVMVLGINAATALAQKPLKGSWTFTIQTPMGTLPVPFTFAKKGKGSFTGPSGALPFAYREEGSIFSVALEGIGLSPDGRNITIIVRGNKTDTTVTGSGIVITDVADPSNPTGFVVTQLAVSGKRN